MSNAVLRAIAHCLMGVVSLLFAAWIARLLGASELTAIGVGMVVALAPGAYDYLGRDLLGRRISGDDPLEEAPFLWIGKRRYTRDRDEILNASDFSYLAGILHADWTYLKPMVQGLTLESWRMLDPDSDIATSVISAVEDKIDAVPDWAVGDKLPMIGLFYADLHSVLLDELAKDFDAGETKQPARVQ